MWAALIHDVTVIYVLVSIHLPWRWLKDLVSYTYYTPLNYLPLSHYWPLIQVEAILFRFWPSKAPLVVTVLVYMGTESFCLVQPHADIKFCLLMSAPQLLNIAAYFTYEMKRKSPFFRRHDEGDSDISFPCRSNYTHARVRADVTHVTLDTPT